MPLELSLTQDTSQITKEIDQKGYAIIEKAIPPFFLNEIKNLVKDKIEQHTSPFSVVGYENLQETLLGQLFIDENFCDYANNIVKNKRNGKELDNKDKYQVLRVLCGDQVNEQSHLYHFDNYTLTVLLPIIIPESENGLNGDLHILPNVRGLSQSANKDALIKLLSQNPITRKLISFSVVRKLLGFKKIKLIPGNLYFFWGFCSFHGNGDCQTGNIRSTALFHFHKTVNSRSFLSKLTSTKKRSRVTIK